MARQRMLNPDFFTDADLLSLTPLHRLLFAGLWCHADREGRVLDKPRDLKLRILPGDACDVGAMLDDLAELGMVRRYSTNGVRCLEIVAFAKHQRPHPKEAPSGLPPPPAVALHGEPRKVPASREEVGSMTVLPSESESDSKSDSKSGSSVVVKEPESVGWLRDEMDAAFKAKRDAVYAWTFKDELAIGVLLGKPDSSGPEIVRRWGLCLDHTYPIWGAVTELSQHWNKCAAPQSTGPPKSVKKGVIGEYQPGPQTNEPQPF